MGQHTWFRKDKETYLKLNEIYDKLYKHETGEEWLDDLDILHLESESSDLYDQNETDYHDLFRTSKRNEDGTYTDDVLFSYEETLKWMEDNKEHVSFSHTVFDSPEKIEENKKWCFQKLREFWAEYPNGVIDFG